MDATFGMILIAAALILAVTGVLFLTYGVLDTTVVKACAQRGYWQTGQVRVVCHVEQREEHTSSKKEQ